MSQKQALLDFELYFTPEDCAFIRDVSQRFPEKNIQANLSALIALPASDRPEDARQRLKTTLRAGWIRTDTPEDQCETVAQHTEEMRQMALNDMRFNGDTVVLLLPMIEDHDLAEPYVGDFTPLDPITKQDKHRLEHLTMRCIYETDPHRLSLWEEGEEGKSLLARWKNELDKLQMFQEASRKLDRFPKRQEHIDYVHHWFKNNQATDQGAALYNKLSNITIKA